MSTNVTTHRQPSHCNLYCKACPVSYFLRCWLPAKHPGHSMGYVACWCHTARPPAVASYTTQHASPTMFLAFSYLPSNPRHYELNKTACCVESLSVGILCSCALHVVSCRYRDDHCLLMLRSKFLNLTLSCFQAIETFMGIGINLVSVSMNYTAPAEAIYNIVISKPPPSIILATHQTVLIFTLPGV